MNREIKFRVWDKETLKMYYPEGVLGKYALEYKYCLGHDLIFGKDYYGEKFSDNYVIQQYIGLKDINEKEIYEGDVVKTIINSNYANAGEYISVVKFDRGRFYVDGNFNNGINFSYKMLLMPGFEHCDVIGNIFENPELLK